MKIITAAKALIKTIISNYIPGLNIIYRIKDEKVYLTFDDGPNEKLTKKVLEILKKENIQATFFLIGKQIEKYPEMVNNILNGGHSLGNHSYSHKHFKQVSLQILVNEVESTDKLLSNYIIENKYYRPPYGEVSFQQIRWLNKNGHRIIFWSLDFMPLLKSLNHNLNTVSEMVKPGEVILLHDDDEAVVEKLPQFISLLKKRGLSFGSISVN